MGAHDRVSMGHVCAWDQDQDQGQSPIGWGQGFDIMDQYKFERAFEVL